MENVLEAKNLISSSKNIYLVTSQEPEAIASTLALFYTLKDLGKNVNLIIDALPENLQFLAPSLDFISYPKNFVISVPDSVAKISQIYYEKNNEAVKIHLTLESGNIKKDNVAFYFSEPKPDLIITVGVKDYQKELAGKLNSFGFLLDSPVLNIDTLANLVQTNQKFGKINLMGDNSLAEIIRDLDLAEDVKKETANCLLSGLIIYTDNFKKRLTADIFEMASRLMKKGADLQKITNNINQ
jgi:nanoRNase/pAp phosphatase (c-di-AMP/oligoRNAs hydrolase)